ncbi:MAG: hypothetical protein ACFFDI_01110, partial [Promethearchaeota archaeon]
RTKKVRPLFLSLEMAAGISSGFIFSSFESRSASLWKFSCRPQLLDDRAVGCGSSDRPFLKNENRI